MKKSIFTLTALSSFGFFAQGFADGGAQGKEGGLPHTMLILGVALIFFYFILWRPEQKRRKQVEAQRNSMKVGDKVTAMGIVGTLDKIQDTTIILKMVDGAKVEMLKNCITDVQSKESKVKEDSSKESKE